MTWQTITLIITGTAALTVGWIFYLRHRRRKAIADRSREIAERIITRIGRDFE